MILAPSGALSKKLPLQTKLSGESMSQSKEAFENIRWIEAYSVSITEEDRQSDLFARREVGKFLSERMKAILLDGFQPTGITARYAVQNRLIYQGNGGYGNAGI